MRLFLKIHSEHPINLLRRLPKRSSYFREPLRLRWDSFISSLSRKTLQKDVSISRNMLWVDIKRNTFPQKFISSTPRDPLGLFAANIKGTTAIYFQGIASLEIENSFKVGKMVLEGSKNGVLKLICQFHQPPRKSSKQALRVFKNHQKHKRKTIEMIANLFESCKNSHFFVPLERGYVETISGP